MKTVAPLYEVPERKKVSSLIDEKHELLSTIYKHKLKNVSTVSITTDIWTETINTSFLGLTCHFVLENKLTSLTLGVFELDQRHNSEYLSECITKLCEERNLPPSKVTAVITDNGANIVKAESTVFGKNKHLPCFAHTLDLVASKITNDIEQIKFVIDKVKTIMTSFKHSVVGADDLRKAQPVNNVLKLEQSVPTRWNSTYYMLERLTKLYEYVAPFLLKSPKAPPMIDASELVLIKEILTLLSPIEAVSKAICGESYLTSSKVIPVINRLIKKIKLLTPSTEEILALTGSLSAEIAKRFRAIEQSKLLAVSTILDPRFKRLHFNNATAAQSATSY